MPEAPAATSVLSTTSTSVPFWAACQAVDRPWTPAPMTRRGVEEGRDSGMLLPPGQCYWRIGTADPKSIEGEGQGGRANPAPGQLGPTSAGSMVLCNLDPADPRPLLGRCWVSTARRRPRGKLHTRRAPGEGMCD